MTQRKDKRFGEQNKMTRNIPKRHICAAAVLAVLLLPFAKALAADEPEVHVRLSADTVMIGDHFYLGVEIKKDMVQVVDFPTLGKQMMNGAFELLDESPVDTLSVEGRMQHLYKRYEMICFDEGVYNIDSFPLLYLDKNIIDTIYARDKNTLYVDTYVVDTVKQTIFDIKDPLDTPLLASEIGGYIRYGLLAAVALVAILYSILRRMRNHQPAVENGKPREAPHVVAIRKLEQLKNQKVWQNNKHKLYYTRLTEILREYIMGRYGISAREMTSDEILDAVREVHLDPTDFAYLERVLKEADMVKFAKVVPEPEQNETAYSEAYYFVENTKQVPESSETQAQAGDTATNDAPVNDNGQKGGEE